MKKLLSIFAAFGLTATTSATVVACEEEKLEFEGGAEITTTVGEHILKDLAFEALGEYKEFTRANKKWLTKNVNLGNIQELVTASEITLVNGDEDLVEIDQIKGSINFKKVGEFELNWIAKVYFKKELVIKSDVTLKVTVTPDNEKPVFSFNF